MDMVMGMEFLEKNRIKQKLVVGVGFFELRNGDQDIYENNLIISYKNQDAVEAYTKAKAAIAYLQKWDDMSAERRDICESVLGCFFDIVNWMLIARDTVYSVGRNVRFFRYAPVGYWLLLPYKFEIAITWGETYQK